MKQPKTPALPVAEQLQQELEMRGKYYFKGLGMVIAVGLVSNLEIFATREATEEIATYIRNCINTLTKSYDSIPFDQITDHPDYDIFLKVKETISELQLEVDQILEGKKDITPAQQLIIFILDLGLEYRARLKAILDKLQEQPGYEKYGFQAKDVIDGKQWTSCI